MRRFLAFVRRRLGGKQHDVTCKELGEVAVALRLHPEHRHAGMAALIRRHVEHRGLRRFELIVGRIIRIAAERAIRRRQQLRAV